MNVGLLSFSFVQGILAFLAPCAVALLPGYITSFVGRDSVEHRLLRTAKVAGSILLGFVAMYAVAGVFIWLASSLIKTYMVYVATGMGILIMMLGFYMSLGYPVSFSWHPEVSDEYGEILEGVTFGIAYGIGALGCLFPLFLLVVTNALQAETVVAGISYLLAYFVGMAGLLVVVVFLAVYARDTLQEYLHSVLPYITRVSGVLLILGGLYTIWYQSALL